MWDYILVLIAVALLAVSFIVQKLYQKGSESTTEGSLTFSITSAVISCLLLILMNGFSIAFTWYSALNALLKSLCGLLYTVLGFRIMKEGKVAFYMLFLMSGGMLVPAIWGWAFLGEEIKPLHVIGVAVIVASIILSNAGSERPSTGTWLRCCAVFVLNGFVSVLSKLHQINTVYASVGTTEYAMLSTVASLLTSILLLVAVRAHSRERTDLGKSFRLRPILIVLLYSILGTVSSLLQLEGARTLPASALYPMITGGTVVLSGLFALIFFKERLSRRGWIGIALCLVGTCLFL